MIKMSSGTSGKSTISNQNPTTGEGSSTVSEGSHHTHLLRKRHSPNNSGGASSKKDELSTAEIAAFAKLRKVQTPTGSKSKNVGENEEKGARSSYDSGSSSGSKRVHELKYLTDYFPDQDQHIRLTRSRVKAANTPKLTSMETEEQPLQLTKTKTSKEKSRRLGSSSHEVRHPVGTTEAPQQNVHLHEERAHHVNRAASFITGLVPRMQHLLSGGSTSVATENARGSSHSSGTAISSREFRLAGMYYMEDPEVAASAIISTMDGLRSTNEIRQSEAATELAEILLLGNEESLPNLPIREIVQLLMNLLQKDHNFELMLTATRCITNMQEALPRALPLLAETIPLLLQKLKRIEYIDVAEQSLIALEVMSRRSAKNILTAGGISATISHVDFFSLPSQRLAFQIAANCATYVSTNDFVLVKDCLRDLTQRLTFVDDKRCLESICLFFNRLIENLRYYPDRLRQIAGTNYEFLKNVQHLVTIQPLSVSTSTFLSLLKSIRYMCTKCGDIAVALMKMEFGHSIQTLLIGSDKAAIIEKISRGNQIGTGSPAVDIISRPPQQFREIIILIGELMPVLPRGNDGDISNETADGTNIDNQVNQFMNYTTALHAQIRTAVRSTASTQPDTAFNTIWYSAVAGTLGSGAEWIPLSPMVSDLLEQSRMIGEPQTVLEMDGEVFEVDFLRMMRRNTQTGVETALDRRPAVGINNVVNSVTAALNRVVNAANKNNAPTPQTNALEADDRDILKQNENHLYAELVSMLLPLLVDIGTNSTCPSLRHELLRVMLRMIYSVEKRKSKYTAEDESESLDAILRDIPLAVYIYNTISTSQTGNRNLGVLVNALRLAHALLEKLPQLYIPLFETEGVFHEVKKVTKLPPPLTPSSSMQQLMGLVQTNQASGSLSSTQASVLSSTTSTRHSKNTGISTGTSTMDVSIKTRSTANIPQSTTSTSTPVSHSESVLRQLISGHGHHPVTSSIAMTTPSILLSGSGIATLRAISSAAGSGTSVCAKNLQEWAVKEATKIIQKYSADGQARKHGIPHKSVTKIYDKLCSVARKFTTQGKDIGCEPLNVLRTILLEHEISAFQLKHSGIVSALNDYLTDPSPNIYPPRRLRLKRFAAIFMDITAESLNQDLVVGAKERFEPFERLVNKVLHAVSQIEQFQVKVTNLSGIIPSGSAAFMSATSFLSAAGGAPALISTTLRGAQALRFFQTHQIRINLKRHPSIAPTPTKASAGGGSGNSGREWRHGRGTIKVDPLTSVEKIERYLVERGIGTGNMPEPAREHSEESSENDEISDEEQDMGYLATLPPIAGRVELYIGENRIPSDMPIIQAIRQFSLPQDEETQETIPASIWVIPHTIYYKPVASSTASNTGGLPSGASKANEASSQPQSDRQGTKSPSPATMPANSSRNLRAAIHHNQAQSHVIRRVRFRAGSSQKTASSSADLKSGQVPTTIKDHPVFRSGQVPLRQSQLDRFLITTLGNNSPLNQDPSAPCLLLLNTLYNLNVYWWSLFEYDSIETDSSVGSTATATSTSSQTSKHYHRSTISSVAKSTSTSTATTAAAITPVNAVPSHLPFSHAPILPAIAFHSSKLNSKVTRQLSDFLSVATQRIPDWTTTLVKTVPFMFTFQTRRSLLYCTAFGRDRALMHLCSESAGDDHDNGGMAGMAAAGTSTESASRLIPRLERRKFTVNRNNLLKDAQNILLNNLGVSKPLLEVGFEGEIGTGFGPTLEFYSTLSLALQKYSLNLWQGRSVTGCGEDSGEEYITSDGGLYPTIACNTTAIRSTKSMETRLKQFEFVGRLLAQALIDSRMLDLELSPAFYKWLLEEETSMGLEDFEKLEPAVYCSLRAMSRTPDDEFPQLEIYFTYPGENDFELLKGGRNTAVSKNNFTQFTNLISYWRLVEGVRLEMEAVRRGFKLVVQNIEPLKMFTPNEMEQLFCGSSESSYETDKAWSKTALQQAIRPDHGFTHDSVQIGWLIDMLHSYSREKRRRFLQFVTGSPRLPVGGFRSLNPPLTVVRKAPASYAMDENGELPSAMTCYNYLKIPPYESYEVFINRFDTALEHVYSFYLT